MFIGTDILQALPIWGETSGSSKNIIYSSKQNDKEPNLERALSGLANYWPVHQSKPILVKKKIILTYWVSKDLFEWKLLELLRNVLRFLMDEGFELYTCDEKLELIKNHTHLQNVLKFIPFIKDSKFQTLQIGANLASDSIFKLDLEGIGKILLHYAKDYKLYLNEEQITVLSIEKQKSLLSVLPNIPWITLQINEDISQNTHILPFIKKSHSILGCNLRHVSLIPLLGQAHKVQHLNLKACSQ